MDIAHFAILCVFSIPIFAVVGGLGVGVIKSIIASSERRLELRLAAQQGTQQGAEQATKQALDAIRAELVALRDTSTQFDMAIEQSMTRLEQRVSRIEADNQQLVGR